MQHAAQPQQQQQQQRGSSRVSAVKSTSQPEATERRWTMLCPDMQLSHSNSSSSNNNAKSAGVNGQRAAAPSSYGQTGVQHGNAAQPQQQQQQQQPQNAAGRRSESTASRRLEPVDSVQLTCSSTTATAATALNSSGYKAQRSAIREHQPADGYGGQWTVCSGMQLQYSSSSNASSLKRGGRQSATP
jgi:hypothetical protein